MCATAAWGTARRLLDNHGVVAFDPEQDLDEDVGYRLTTNTSVTLFWQPQILDQTVAWLTEHGYQVTRLAAANWSSESDLHRNIAEALHFPGYYGRNLDALNDCMRDVVAQDYGWARGTTGVGVGLHRLRQV